MVLIILHHIWYQHFVVVVVVVFAARVAFIGLNNSNAFWQQSFGANSCTTYSVCVCVCIVALHAVGHAMPYAKL
jgi:hypothetical protein